jgi:hypothetical protein
MSVLSAAKFVFINNQLTFMLYYISEQKTKRLDVYSLFVREYHQIYRGNEIIQKSSFLKRLKNYLYTI